MDTFVYARHAKDDAESKRRCYSFSTMKAASVKTVSYQKTVSQKPALEKAPDLLGYTNYRQFLQDYYQAQKAADPNYSLRFFAKKAKFPSHGLLKYLMEGK